ncbi:MAG: FHA domain-containing protein [Proteobacteria bacterium]|jgi:pSer/pThr/pTyr-binding forkhead associated (FHA) protein|nr:FHA domain-containing protein [Pseudomonadota bacterium]
MADIPVLVCIAGKWAGKRFCVPESGLSVGRAEENNIVLMDDGVSRYHATFMYDNGSLWLRDAGSRNGVFVDDQRVTGHKALKVGNRITIAEHTFEVRWEDQTALSEAETEEIGTGSKKRRWYWPFS